MRFNSSIKHPREEIMRELIKDQWTKDSIFAAVIDVEDFLIDEIKDYFQ